MLIVLLICSLSACQNRTVSDNPESKGAITVGSKAFSENDIVAELYALALEEAGYTVNRSYNLSTDVCHQSLLSGEIDIYPEYTGTSFLNILKLDPVYDKEEVYNTVKKEYAKRFNLAVLEQSDIDDAGCVIMLKERAAELGIENLGDLQRLTPQLTFAVSLAMGSATRKEWETKSAIYGPFNWKEEKDIDMALYYVALDNEQVDVISALTTAPQLSSGMYTIIEENIPATIPYFLTPIVRQETLEQYPDVERIVNGAQKSLNNPVIIELVTRTDIDKEEFTDVARDYFEKNIKGKL